MYPANKYMPSRDCPRGAHSKIYNYHLYVLQKIRSGLIDARENGTISQEEVESRLSKWLSE
jgi:hypothetical protein